MNRLAAGSLCRGDETFTVEIGGGSPAREGDRRIRFHPVQRIGIVFRVNGDAADTQVGAGACDSDGDLAAVGDEDAFKHDQSCASPEALNAARALANSCIGFSLLFFVVPGLSGILSDRSNKSIGRSI